MKHKRLDKIISSLLPALIGCLFFIIACGDNNSTNDTSSGSGDIFFNIAYQIDGTYLRHPAVLDCIDIGISTIEAAVYDEDNYLIAEGGPWDCSIGHGTIQSAPAGSDRKIIVLGKDANKNNIFRGEKTGINIVGGNSNNAGKVDCYGFVPIVLVPENKELVNDDSVTFTWNDVEGAAHYRIFIWNSIDLNNPIINEITNSSTFTYSEPTNATTYFWQVFASDASSNTGHGSEILSFVVNSVSDVGKLPDTGQITSYTDIFGEDSDYSINAPEYTKMDASGNVLDDSADEWAMVRNEVTGLIWEVKTSYGGIHYKNYTYNWQDGQDLFIAQLNNENFGGHSDWRLPTFKELYTLVDKDASDPAINITYFPNTISDTYWSSTADTNNVALAWYVDFSLENISLRYKSGTYYVRAVHGGQPSMKFGNNSDGTVTDENTGLMWQQSESREMTWEEALSYCENLNIAGHEDWRLPNINELQSIVDYETVSPAVSTLLFPDAHSSIYWSSTTNNIDPNRAWRILFTNGAVDFSDKQINCKLRAVRGGK